MSAGPWLRRILLVLLAALFAYSLSDVGLLETDRLQRGVQNTGRFLRGLFPPAWDVLPDVARAAGETVQIAFIGTALGLVLALPLSVAASPAITGRGVALTIRLLLAAVRTVPALLWAIIFVVAVGLGPAAGSLGVAMYSLGYMGKLFSEAFDGVDPEVLEAVRSAGLGRVQLARYALLPEAANQLLSQLLFMFEYNVRSSSIMGFVGAGGIGYYLLGYVQTLRYQELTTALLVTLVVVLAIDRLSALVRAAFLSGRV